MPYQNHSSHTPLRQIELHNLLSFGPDTAPINFGELNVLIGPNGSGKSNLIDAIALLKSTASNIREGIRMGGGVSEWIWKGNNRAVASIDAVINNPKGSQPLRHILAFRAENQIFRLEDERIENLKPYAGENSPYFYYRYQNGNPVLNIKGGERNLARENVVHDESILVQRKDPESYPEISYLSSVYEQIRIYQAWAFGRKTRFRDPQQVDSRNDRLEEDFSNLSMFLNRLRRHPKAKSAIINGLRKLYEGLDDFDISVEGGTVQVFFTEGDFTIPATRLSDGTLRFLCLLAILCDPTPAPLICIEEPELGLHPDIIPTLAELLLEASKNTQLIVTTHSDILVDALTEHPEVIMVCEKHQGQTQIQRLNAKKLEVWLENYRLGELWTRGELGGTRW